MIPQVFLDANILYSGTCRSLFIWLHENRAIKIYWSQEVWDEVFKNMNNNNSVEKAHKFKLSMKNNAIQKYPECLVTLGPIIPIGLSDINDEHVVTGAKQCHAQFIITDDNDLLQFDLSSHNLIAKSADDFVYDEVILKTPNIFIQSVFDHISNLQHSRPKKLTYFESLIKSKMLRTNHWLKHQDEQDKLFDEIW